jgi:hypothetical protein
MENIMAVNLIMIDNAIKDRRSVQAMLCGRGDRREQLWEFFSDTHSSMTQEELMDEFHLSAQYGQRVVKHEFNAIFCKRYIAIFIAFLLIVA